MQPDCSNCGAALTGEFCAACGQRRLERLTLGGFATDVVRRVFRFDKALAVTVWRMLREPGRLVNDYLAGRRSGYLDPLHYLGPELHPIRQPLCRVAASGNNRPRAARTTPAPRTAPHGCPG